MSDAKSDEVAQLRELCPPTVSDPFLRHVLEKVAKGDVQVRPTIQAHYLYAESLTLVASLLVQLRQY